MALGPRKHGVGRRLVAKPRRRKPKAARATNESPWSPAAYREREARQRRENLAAFANFEQPPLPGDPIIESDWTIPACAAREEMRRAQESSPPIMRSEWTLDAYASRSTETRREPPAREPLGDAVVLESDWTLRAYAAREDMRRILAASPPIMESDWTLVAYRERNEALAVAAPAPAGAVINAHIPPTAPEIRIDAPPSWFEQPTPGREGAPLRRLAYAAAAAAIIVMAALVLRRETPVATAPTSPDKLKSRPVAGPAALAPRPTTAPAPETLIPAPAPPPELPRATPAEVGPGGAPAPAATVSPPATGALPSAAAPTPASAPAANKPEAGAQPAPATTTTPERPAESRTSAPRKPRAAEPHQKPARERQREGRGQPNWFDEMVNSVKRLGRVLTP